jgi:hypothetical protein
MRAPPRIDAAILESHTRVRDDDAKSCGFGFGTI